jgi:hypothetical protein
VPTSSRVHDDQKKEKEKPKRTILIQLDSAERRPELAQEILAGFAERTPGFGEDN